MVLTGSPITHNLCPGPGFETNVYDFILHEETNRYGCVEDILCILETETMSTEQTCVNKSLGAP